MLYISVDVEASGPIPGIYNLVSVGATPVWEEDGRFRIGDEDFYVELKPAFAGFSEEAMAVHGLSREHLETKGLPPGEAMERFARWVADLHGGTPPRPIFVGHNAAFDWAYVNYYFAHAEVANPFNIFPLDIKALTMGCLAIPWARARKAYFREALGAEAIDESERHKADYDARYQAQMFVNIMERVFRGATTAPDGDEITPED